MLDGTPRTLQGASVFFVFFLTLHFAGPTGFQGFQEERVWFWGLAQDDLAEIPDTQPVADPANLSFSKQRFGPSKSRWIESVC